MPSKTVFIVKTHPSPCAPIPHIGSEGILCEDADHKVQAAGKVCVAFSKPFYPSDGSSLYHPGKLHLFFDSDSLSPQPIAEDQVEKMKAAFYVEQEAKWQQTKEESARAMQKLQAMMKDLNLGR